MIYLALISCVIYLLYNMISIIKNKIIPSCLSDTYYTWPLWVFPLIMILISGMLLPVWLELLEKSNFQFLAFITCASIIFVGAAPNYKNNKLEYNVHSICAYLACITSILSITIVMGYWKVLVDVLITQILCSLLFFEFKETKRTWLYLIENSLFISVYISILNELIK